MPRAAGAGGPGLLACSVFLPGPPMSTKKRQGHAALVESGASGSILNDEHTDSSLDSEARKLRVT